MVEVSAAGDVGGKRARLAAPTPTEGDHFIVAHGQVLVGLGMSTRWQEAILGRESVGELGFCVIISGLVEATERLDHFAPGQSAAGRIGEASGPIPEVHGRPDILEGGAGATGGPPGDPSFCSSRRDATACAVRAWRRTVGSRRTWNHLAADLSLSSALGRPVIQGLARVSMQGGV